MRRIAKMLVVILGAALLAVVGTTFNPRTAHGLVAALVQVSNSPAAPAITLDVSRLASQNVQLVCVGTSNCSQILPDGSSPTPTYIVPPAAAWSSPQSKSTQPVPVQCKWTKLTVQANPPVQPGRSPRAVASSSNIPPGLCFPPDLMSLSTVSPLLSRRPFSAAISSTLSDPAEVARNRKNSPMSSCKCRGVAHFRHGNAETSASQT